MSKRVGGFINQDGLNAPDPATGVSASAGDAQADVSFTAPADVGGSAITGFVATSDDGIGATGPSSPITVSGLSNGTAYTFRVWALNAFGYSAPSDASGSVSPSAPRGVFAGGTTTGAAASNTIDYITFAGGNAIDFGDLTTATSSMSAGCGSATRGLLAAVGSSSRNSNINFITFATTGNASSFGNLGRSLIYNCGCSNDVRGLFAGGVAFAAHFNNIDYVTIATTGSSLDFGDLLLGLTQLGATAGATRGIFAGGVDGTPLM
jgi:hypothetical protein